MFLFGLRSNGKRSTPSVVSLKPTHAIPYSERDAPRPLNPVQVIHLTPEASPLKTDEMTQQQKIAAALTRAGISNGPWQTKDAGPARHNSSIRLMTADLESTQAGATLSNLTGGVPSPRSFWKPLLLWSGATLTLLSLYVLLRLKSIL